jgi:A/G-specific adenine glycosylase
MSTAFQRSPSTHFEFRARLLAWYKGNARNLPWRETHDPYSIWVSEIMLQQTRVAAVIAHYYEFLRRFPSVERLAAARESSVLAAWSGLGYYRRARMMHAAAKVIVRKLAGKFPETAAAWSELPGIGRYTSAAIASIGFGEAVAAVDGNVERVLERITGKHLAAGECRQAADDLLDCNHPGDFNQAMMELGATVCTPRSPTCLMCPVIDLCSTRGPLSSLERAPRQTKRQIDYALAQRRGAVFLVRRSRNASLMAGMWELPELNGVVGEASFRSSRNGKAAKLWMTLRHSITVTNYEVRVWRGKSHDARGKWIPLASLPKLALTGLARKILRRAELLAVPQSSSALVELSSIRGHRPTKSNHRNA